MKIDRVHFYVEDARASCDWFVRYLGFQRVGGHNSSHTYTEVVQSGSVCFWLSSSLSNHSPVAEFLRQHPPGVADVAFVVEDVAAVIARAQAYDATILQPIQEYQQNGEYGKSAKIAAWGGLTHTLIERSGGVEEWGSGRVGDSLSFCTAIDHLVLNVATGDLQQAVAWYGNILDFQPQQAFKIQSARSALFSQVLISRDGNVQLPINEPASANSQIQEFLNLNRGAGIQHIALHTPNIVQAIAKFRSCGLALLPVPQSYYTQLKTKLPPLLPEEFEAIAQQEILIDWKDTSEPQTVTPLLLQIFTQPIFGQPTFFLELIERRSQAQGFGEGNFRALFEAIESEQIKRGSLN